MNNATNTATVSFKINAKGAARVTVERDGKKLRSTVSAKKVGIGGTYRVLVGTATAAGAAHFYNTNEGDFYTMGNWARTTPVAQLRAEAREIEARGHTTNVEIVEVTF